MNTILKTPNKLWTKKPHAPVKKDHNYLMGAGIFSACVLLFAGAVLIARKLA